MKFRLVIFSIALFLLLRGSLDAHPHVFIYHAVTFVFDDQGLAGFKLDWVFDEMFSNMFIHDYDKNENGRFEDGEVAALREGAFSNLKNFDYFTHVRINGKPFKVRFVKDFKAKISRNRVLYQFFVPCHVKAASSFKEVILSVHDKSFYCSVFLVRDQILFENDSPYEHHFSIARNPKQAFYYGQVYPEEITFKFRRKDG